MTSLEKSILATIVYYDVLDRPLTGWEVFKYLVNLRTESRCGLSNADSEARPENDALAPQGTSFSMTSLLETLENSQELAKFISQENGFYFLKNRNKIVQQRIKRQLIADQKWKKARRLVRFLQIIPYIRMVLISGSLAINNSKEESDIDLMIITQAGRIWTCRGLTTLFIHLFGQRRHGQLTKDRFCLNHYLTDQSLKIPYQSLYNAQTYAHLVPLWQTQNNIYQKFQKANLWLNDYLVFYPMTEQGYLNIVRDISFFRWARKIREGILNTWLGNSLESLLRRFQIKRIKKDPLTYKSGGRVVFNDKQLEFHPDSPEKKILEKYNQKMKELGFEEMGQEKDSGLTI